MLSRCPQDVILPLTMQTRHVKLFARADGRPEGFSVASLEGRVAIRFVAPEQDVVCVSRGHPALLLLLLLVLLAFRDECELVCVCVQQDRRDGQRDKGGPVRLQVPPH